MDRSRAATRETYDEIATHFAETRRHPWPEVEAFLANAPTGTVGLDVGCGNGRHFAPLAECVDHAIGLDLSIELLAIARDRAPDVAALVAGDAAVLPLADDSVDLAIYVAALHHLPTREHRRASLDELARVLASGGRGLVSVWSTAHERFDHVSGFDTEIDWELPDGDTVPRYYHVYDPTEFGTDLAASDLAVLETWVSSGNAYARVTR